MQTSKFCHCVREEEKPFSDVHVGIIITSIAKEWGETHTTLPHTCVRHTVLRYTCTHITVHIFIPDLEFQISASVICLVYTLCFIQQQLHSPLYPYNNVWVGECLVQDQHDSCIMTKWGFEPRSTLALHTNRYTLALTWMSKYELLIISSRKAAHFQLELQSWR